VPWDSESRGSGSLRPSVFTAMRAGFVFGFAPLSVDFTEIFFDVIGRSPTTKTKKVFGGNSPIQRPHRQHNTIVLC
jgi:hypothetical protein